MTPEQGNPTPKEATPAQSVTFYELTYRFFKSDQFAAYKPNTQTQYRQDLARFLRSAPSGGEIDIPTAISVLQELGRQNTNAKNVKARYAIKAAIAWGTKQNIVDEESIDLINQVVVPSSDERKPTIPLTKIELQNLFIAASGNVRDRALITTIVITQPTSEELESLKKEDVYKNSEGQTLIKIGDEEIIVPEGIAPFIQDYTETLKQSHALFPRTQGKDKTIAMTRAGVHIILNKYKREANLPSLSHMVLVRTGQEFFSNIRKKHVHRLSHRTKSAYTPQIPLP